jgi:hypothetical protein
VYLSSQSFCRLDTNTIVENEKFRVRQEDLMRKLAAPKRLMKKFPVWMIMRKWLNILVNSIVYLIKMYINKFNNGPTINTLTCWTECLSTSCLSSSSSTQLLPSPVPPSLCWVSPILLPKPASVPSLSSSCFPSSLQSAWENYSVSSFPLFLEMLESILKLSRNS